MQGELSQVLYPLFLYSYINLVSKDATALARELFNK